MRTRTVSTRNLCCRACGIEFELTATEVSLGKRIRKTYGTVKAPGQPIDSQFRHRDVHLDSFMCDICQVHLIAGLPVVAVTVWNTGYNNGHGRRARRERTTWESEYITAMKYPDWLKLCGHFKRVNERLAKAL